MENKLILISCIGTLKCNFYARLLPTLKTKRYLAITLDPSRLAQEIPGKTGSSSQTTWDTSTTCFMIMNTHAQVQRSGSTETGSQWYEKVHERFMKLTWHGTHCFHHKLWSYSLEWSKHWTKRGRHSKARCCEAKSNTANKKKDGKKTKT